MVRVEKYINKARDYKKQNNNIDVITYISEIDSIDNVEEKNRIFVITKLCNIFQEEKDSVILWYCCRYGLL